MELRLGWYYHLEENALYHQASTGCIQHSMYLRRSRAQVFHSSDKLVGQVPPSTETQIALLHHREWLFQFCGKCSWNKQHWGNLEIVHTLHRVSGMDQDRNNIDHSASSVQWILPKPEQSMHKDNHWYPQSGVRWIGKIRNYFFDTNWELQGIHQICRIWCQHVNTHWVPYYDRGTWLFLKII